MTPAEAKILIQQHSYMYEADISHPKVQNGFLGSLRPYRGLIEENYHEVIAAIRVLAPEFNQPRVDRDLVCNIWQICMFARNWGVHPDGMLQRNKLIGEEDVDQLESWIDAIEEAVNVLFHSDDLEAAFAAYYQSLDPD